MAAISLSARDIEQRVHAILQRLRIRARLHALGYALGATLALCASLAWWKGWEVVTNEPAWSGVLFVSLTVILAVLMSAVVERKLDRQAVVAWVDRTAGLEFRLATFAALQGLPRRSPLFSVLVLQLFRLLPRYEPAALAPWRPVKPMAAVLGGLTALLWVVTQDPQASPGREAELAMVGERKAAADDTGERARASARSARDHSATLASESEGEDATGLEEGEQDVQDGAAAATARRGGADERSAAVKAAAGHARRLPGAPVRSAYGRAQGESQERVGHHSEVSRADPGADASRTKHSQLAASGAMPQSRAESQQKPGAEPSSTLRARPTGGDAAQRNPDLPGRESNRLSGPDSSRPQAGQSAGAGAGTDGMGVYGEPGNATALGSKRSGQPVVIQLPVTSVVRGSPQRQGGTPRDSWPQAESASDQGNADAISPLVEKPLLPAEYESLARRLFSRSSQP